jgi:farnesyl-diphosphate farnesyltransferase
MSVRQQHQVSAPPEPETTPRQPDSSEDMAYQARILPEVSRTFALTIPELPSELTNVVGNAYLLCRLADTIEDDPGMESDAKSAHMSEFLAVLQGQAPAEEFSRRLLAELSPATPAAERDLVANTATVVRITYTFSSAQRKAMFRCVTTMGSGMPEFQQHKTLDGLPGLVELDRYCYYVAGIVGEMLTDLFCDYCEELQPHRDEMMSLSVCFGQGLQMTNILKDIWEDRASGTCWLPRDRFGNSGGELASAMLARDGEQLTDGIRELIGIAHAHLRAAMKYTQMIPKSEPGIRRFCLWAIGMAILTLRKINANPGFQNAGQVKISRRTVKLTIALCNMAQSSDRALTMLFDLASRGLPLAPSADFCPPPGARLASDRLT